MQNQAIPKWISITLISLIFVSLVALVVRFYASRGLGWNQLRQTHACQKQKPSSDLLMPQQLTRLVISKKIQTKLVSDPQTCIVKGQYLSLLPNLEPSLWVLRRKIGTAQVVELKSVTWEEIDRVLARQLGYSDPNSLKRQLIAENGPEVASQPLALVKFDLVKKDYFDTRSPIIPFETPYARAINKTWAHYLLSKNYHFFDLRPSLAYRQEHLPQAISVPYQFGKYPRDVIYARFDKMLQQGDALNLDAFPPKKQTPFVVYGQNPTDVGALRALAILHRHGWRNIYWYWGGMDDWAQRPLIPPEQDPRIQIITADGLEKMLPSGAHLVDVRSPESFQKGRIPNAKNVPVFIRADGKTSDRVSFSLNLRQLPARRQSLLVFYGENDLSWEPYRAALWAKNHGWQNVYWLRGGFSHWRAAAELFRNRYRWVRSRNSPPALTK